MVEATKEFFDIKEGKQRKEGDKFECTKEREKDLLEAGTVKQTGKPKPQNKAKKTATATKKDSK